MASSSVRFASRSSSSCWSACRACGRSTSGGSRGTEKIVAHDPALDQPPPIGRKKHRHPRVRLRLRGIFQPPHQPGDVRLVAQTRERRSRSTFQHSREGGLMASRASELRHSFPASGRDRFLPRRVGKFRGEVAVLPGRDRLTGERLSFPRQLQPRGTLRRRTIGDPKTMKAGFDVDRSYDVAPVHLDRARG